MTQALYSRVLSPLTEVVLWALPAILVLAVGAEITRTIRFRRVGEPRVGVEAQRRRDSRLLLVGAIVGTAAAHVPVLTFASARLGLLFVLPAVGAAVGLAVSGLLPPVEDADRRVAVLERRSIASYVSPSATWLMWAACAFTGVLATMRLVLPPEAPLPDEFTGRFDARFILSPTRTLYVVIAVAAVALTGTAWAAAIAIVRRGRPASDAAGSAREDRARRESVGRLVSWTTATLLLLNAALMTPFPARMGGVVLGDVQLVQRATDILIVAFVLAAGVVAARAYLGTDRTSRGATT